MDTRLAPQARTGGGVPCLWSLPTAQQLERERSPRYRDSAIARWSRIIGETFASPSSASFSSLLSLRLTGWTCCPPNGGTCIADLSG